MCHGKRRILSDALGAGYPDFYGEKHAVWVIPVGLARGGGLVVRSTVCAAARSVAGGRKLTPVCMICINPKLNLPLHNDGERPSCSQPMSPRNFLNA